MKQNSEIRAVPVSFDGITFRSTLEADWAATFASLGWYYEYEPWAVDLGDGIRYLCDFHLPAQNVWCEVKGGHNRRMHKTRRFHRATGSPRPGSEMVVVLRPAGPGGAANWHHVTGYRRYIPINQCRNCREWSFGDPIVEHQMCRTCKAPDGLIWDFGDNNRTYTPAVRYEAARKSHSDAYMEKIYGTHGRLPFARAPRRGRTA